MNKIDLHVHSTASDGSMTPKELVEHAKKNGLTVIALTDHDTIDGLKEALQEGEKHGIKVIPGIEIGVDFKFEMHILGYFTKETYQNILPFTVNLKKNRNERNIKMIKKLNSFGLEITLAEVESQAKGEITARPHFAKVLINKGYAKNIKEAFERLIGDGKPGYVKKDKLTPEEGISEIIKAGGIAVLAHPIHLNLTEKKLEEVVGMLKSYGLSGIEVYYVDNNNSDTDILIGIARRNGLISTGGSDFHGNFKPHIKIGVGKGNLRIPESCLEGINKLLKLTL